MYLGKLRNRKQNSFSITTIAHGRNHRFHFQKTQTLSVTLRDNHKCASFLTSYPTNRIFHALPIVPFTSRNQRVQRFAYLLLAEFGDELLKLALNVIIPPAYRRLRRHCGVSRALSNARGRPTDCISAIDRCAFLATDRFNGEWATFGFKSDVIAMR
jgi:hypothetical protein